MSMPIEGRCGYPHYCEGLQPIIDCWLRPEGNVMIMFKCRHDREISAEAFRRYHGDPVAFVRDRPFESPLYQQREADNG